MSNAVQMAHQMINYNPQPSMFYDGAVQRGFEGLRDRLAGSPQDADEVRRVVADYKRNLSAGIESAPKPPTPQAAHDFALKCAMTGIMLGTVDAAVQAAGHAAPQACRRSPGGLAESVDLIRPTLPLMTADDAAHILTRSLNEHNAEAAAFGGYLVGYTDGRGTSGNLLT